MDTIFRDVTKELKRQQIKWGEQNHPILDPLLLDAHSLRMCQQYEIPSEQRAKFVTDLRADRGDLTYMDILVEEVSEVASCGRDTKALREELIQVAAVTISMIKSLDRNGR